MIPGMDPKKGMLALLEKYPDMGEDLCKLINRQQKDAKVIAEALSGEQFPAKAVTTTDLKRVVQEHGPIGLLTYFDLFHEQAKAIVERIVQHHPEGRKRLETKAATAIQQQKSTSAPTLNCPKCEQPLLIEGGGAGNCPDCETPIIVEPSDDGYTIRLLTDEEIATIQSDPADDSEE